MNNPLANLLRRRWVWGFITFLFLIGALVAFTGSEAFLRFAAGRAESLSGWQLHLDGIHGSLYGPLQIDKLVVSTKEKRFEIQDARLDWSPRDLWQHHVQVSQLAVASLHVIEIKPSSEPLELPDSLALPISLAIPKATLDRLTVQTSAGEQSFSGIVLGLDKPADTYRLTLQGMTTPWGQVQGQASMAQGKPYALDGHGRFEHASGTASFKAAGTLERLTLSVTAALAGGQTDANLLFTPFAPRPLAEANVTAHGLDPATWEASLPKARIDLDATLTAQAADAFAGKIALSNALPGAWDRTRLPLKSLSAQIIGTLDGADLTGLDLDLGQGGQFTGKGRVTPNGLNLTLLTSNFDPHGLHGQARTMHLAGTISLKADAGQKSLVADLVYRRYRLNLDATLRDRVLQLKKVLLSSGNGRLNLSGALNLDKSRKFDLTGELAGFDPAAFGEYPQASINARFNGAGTLDPALEGTLDFAIRDSHFRRQPLSGHGAMRLSSHRLWDSNVLMTLAGNHLELRGAFGAPGDKLDFRLTANQLSVIDPALTGRVNATGTLSGELAAPTGQIDLAAEGLVWGKDYRLNSLHAKGHIDQGLNGDIRLNADLAGLSSPQLSLDQASATAKGRRSGHTLHLAARNPDFDLVAELAGAWPVAKTKTKTINQVRWSGRVVSLHNQGRYPLALLAQASLELGPNRLDLAGARFTFQTGTLNVQRLHYQDGQFSSQGEFKGLNLASLGKLGNLPDELSGDLSLAGEWAFDAREHVNGRLVLRREHGDLVLATDPPAGFGLSALNLTLEAKDDQLDGRLDAEGTSLGRLRAAARSRLSRHEDRWGFSGDTPFQLSANLTLQSLAWAAPFLDRTGATQLRGSLKAQLQGEGSFAAPRFNGTASGERIRLAWPNQGMSFSDGQFQAELSQGTLELKSLSLRGGDGLLTGQGRLSLAEDQPDMQLALKADKFKLISRPDRLLILSGTGQLALVKKTLQVDASLKADQGQFELAREDVPQISEDVVVVGREAPPAKKGKPYAVRMNLALDLGDRFFLKGRGLDAQLGGAVNVTAKDGGPLSGIGTIRVVKGTYSAYGQSLTIDRGVLNFQGPLDSPGLNIIAMRKNQTVEAGVSITGNAHEPLVKLVSTPTVPDSEKLSWLVLGHGMADASAGEFDSLQLAAGALLGAGESVTLQQRIANAAGLDEVSLKGAGALESSVLTLGKRLSRRAYLSYEQGLAGSEAVFKINYTLTHRLSVRTQAGTAPAVDLFYTFSFD